MSTTAVNPLSVKTSIKIAIARGSAKTGASELIYAKPEMECFSTIGINLLFISPTTCSKSSGWKGLEIYLLI